MTSVTVHLNGDEGPPSDLPLLWADHEPNPVRAELSDLVAGTDPSDAAVDLLAVAASVYAADKAILRRWAPDRWTRSIELNVPQIDPGRWTLADLERFLGHLTGDRWTVCPYVAGSLRERVMGPATPPLLAAPTSVALFSGGLDSFAFAAMSAKQPLKFVSHMDKSALAPRQRELALGIAGQGPPLAMRQFTFWVQRKGPIVDEPEGSTRSRSFVFIAAAVLVADGTGSNEVVVPENGFISLNPPLVPGRRGTLSTRTTHPWTIHLLNGLLADRIDVTVRNPFAHMTKGDITVIALDHAAPDLVFRTISCSRARARQKDKLHFGNCGYCYPCLVRRAGFLAAGVKDPGPYRVDPRNDPFVLRGGIGDDFKAVVSGIRQPFTIRNLTASAPLPLGSDYDALVDVIERSRTELVAMIEDGLTNAVRTAIGW